jgi:hypothetical protein
LIVLALTLAMMACESGYGGLGVSAGHPSPYRRVGGGSMGPGIITAGGPP